jgi:hypothetical protein
MVVRREPMDGHEAGRLRLASSPCIPRLQPYTSQSPNYGIVAQDLLHEYDVRRKEPRPSSARGTP